MHLIPRQGCVQCSVTLPSCNPACGPNHRCDLIVQTCSSCATAVCNFVGGPTSSPPKSVSAGAVIGAILGAMAIVVISFAFVYYRRRRAHLNAALKRATVEIKPDIVASAETVLGRPDPIEKPPVVSDPPALYTTSPPENPFADQASIATASDRATNVIPIAYMAPSSVSMAPSNITNSLTANTPASVATTQGSSMQDIAEEQSVASSGFPTRPERGPDIDMRLNLSRPTSEAPSSVLMPPKTPYAASTQSGLSSRASTMSTTSSFLHEAPQIITPLQGNFRQVLGVQKAEVVQLSSLPSTPRVSISTRGTKTPHSIASRSPLGQVAFNADDVKSGRELNGHLNPFTDPFTRPGTADSSSSFGEANGWDPESRPTSALSQADSIVANISSATRVQFSQRAPSSSPGSSPANSAPPTPRTGDFRTPGQLSPPSQRIPRSFDDLMGRRMSEASLATTNRTSMADSVLEAFPFVPPSPMSMHHNNSQPPTPMNGRSLQQQQQQQSLISPVQPMNNNHQLFTAPDRSTLGMSIMSSSSAGLGAFPFQFESPSPRPSTNTRMESASTRSSQASLDTLDLSRDISAFPLPSEPSTPKSNTHTIREP